MSRTISFLRGLGLAGATIWFGNCGFAASAVAAAQTAAPAAQATPKPQGERVICRSEQEIGTRLETKKHCLTATQWRQLEHDQRMTVEHAQIFSYQH